MRMYLSSFDIGTSPDQIVSLVGQGRRAAIIVNALDHRERARAEWLENQRTKMTALGFSVEELDLRKFFGTQGVLSEVLSQLDLVWINGGNAFLLRRAMKQSGFDILIADLLRYDKIVYAGFSAAAVIVSSTLRALDRVSDPSELADGYDPAVVWEGLALLPFSIVVHVDSDHPESAAVSAEVEFYQRNNMAFRTLRDGEVLLVDGNRCEVVS